MDIWDIRKTSWKTSILIGRIITSVVEEVSHFEQKYDKKIPVIAAGGIYTGEDIKRMIDLGASGVQLGTRFVTTTECDASEAFKQTYIQAEEKDIEIIKSPVGMPDEPSIAVSLRK